MIKLNCTYEESKKILELGYDFSKICTEWQFNFYPPNDDPSKGKIVKWFKLGEYLVNPTLIGMLPRQEVDLLNTYTIDSEEALADLKNYKMGDEYAPLIPIIPKTALEACLPDKLDVVSLNNYVIVRNCVFVKNIDLKTINLSYFFEDYYSCYEEQKEFKSAFEAFTWCHNNYPEELKKKFEEVMK